MVGAGADDGTRTRDLQLGKLTCYQLRYIRPQASLHHSGRGAATAPPARRAAPSSPRRLREPQAGEEPAVDVGESTSPPISRVRASSARPPGQRLGEVAVLHAREREPQRLAVPDERRRPVVGAQRRLDVGGMARRGPPRAAAARRPARATPVLTTAVTMPGTSARASAAALSSPERYSAGTPNCPASSAARPNSPTSRLADADGEDACSSTCGRARPPPCRPWRGSRRRARRRSRGRCPASMLSGVGEPLTSVHGAGRPAGSRLRPSSWASQTTTSSAPAAAQPSRTASRSARMWSRARCAAAPRARCPPRRRRP